MTEWVMTAMTVYCDAVEDEVTLIATQDGSLKCTGYDRYFTPNRQAAKSLQSKAKRLKKKLRCESLECHRVTGYRDKLLSEPV